MCRCHCVLSSVDLNDGIETSFGIEDQAIAHAIFTAGLEIDVVTFDTGRLFPETVELWDHTERRYGRQIRGLSPDRESIERIVARDGVKGFRLSVEARLACRAVRKVEPLARALAGASAWITGLRADQSPERAPTAYATVDPQYRLVKINPLFDWTRDRVVAFVLDHRVPYNPLHCRNGPNPQFEMKDRTARNWRDRLSGLLRGRVRRSAIIKKCQV